MITQDELREAFDYHQDGHLVWKLKVSHKNVVGAVAGTSRRDGYRMVSIRKKKIYLHRAVWIWHHGEIPHGLVVDHINRNPSDCRVENLRLLSHCVNLLNSGPQRNNTSGYRGVTFSRAACKWMARSGKRYIGLFATAEEAASAYEAERSRAFFSPGGV